MMESFLFLFSQTGGRRKDGNEKNDSQQLWQRVNSINLILFHQQVSAVEFSPGGLNPFSTTA